MYKDGKEDIITGMVIFSIILVSLFVGVAFLDHTTGFLNQAPL